MLETELDDDTQKVHEERIGCSVIKERGCKKKNQERNEILLEFCFVDQQTGHGQRLCANEMMPSETTARRHSGSALSRSMAPDLVVAGDLPDAVARPRRCRRPSMAPDEGSRGSILGRDCRVHADLEEASAVVTLIWSR